MNEEEGSSYGKGEQTICTDHFEQAVAHLLEQREQYSYSYIQVNDAQMESFAPVVAQLVGK